MKNIKELFKKVPQKPRRPQKPDKPSEFLKIDRVKFEIFEGDNLGEKFSFIKEDLKGRFCFKSDESKDLFEKEFKIEDLNFEVRSSYYDSTECYLVVESNVLEKYFRGEFNLYFKTEVKRYEQKLSQFKEKEEKYKEDLKNWEKERKEAEEYNKKLEEKIGQLIEDVVE